MGSLCSRISLPLCRSHAHTPPPRPSSVCKLCWKGPIAAQFGLFSEHFEERQHSEPSPERKGGYSYSTTLEALESRAATGCVWCRFLVTIIPGNCKQSKTVEIRVGTRVTASLHRTYSPDETQELWVLMNGQEAFAGYVHTAASGYHCTIPSS